VQGLTCVDIVPPMKWACVDLTPAPTFSPTPHPTVPWPCGESERERDLKEEDPNAAVRLSAAE
jgi:hypothetical protein